MSVEEGSVPNESSTTLTVHRRIDHDYDPRRNPKSEKVSAGGATHTVVQRTFDLRGRLECEARRMNPAVFVALPVSACTLGTEGSFGPDRITRNVYDAAAQLLQVQRAYGTPLQQNYATYTYSANGKRKTVKDANNNLSTLEYDGFDRLAKLRFPVATSGANQSSTTDFELYGYDAVGNRTSLTKRDGREISYAYVGNDPLNKTDPTGLCESMMTCTMQSDDEALLAGEMSADEYQERVAARAAGGIAGAAVVAAGVATRSPRAAGAAGLAAAKTVLTKQQQKAIRSLQKQIEKHRQKLDEFKKNPTIKEEMKDVPEEEIKRQQERRTEILEKQIKTFEKEIEKIQKPPTCTGSRIPGNC